MADNIPGFTRGDRLGLTAFGSVLAHMILVLGVSFTMPEGKPRAEPLPTLEITLVNSRSDSEPDVADFLAQANQEGGGDSDKAVIARSPLPLEPTPRPTPQIPVARLAPAPGRSESKPVPDLLTQDRKPAEQLAKATPQEERSKAPPVETKPGLVERKTRRDETSQLSAEISRFWEEYQKRPRRKFLSARTKEYKYAAYMEAWRARVERVGNLNYPDQARRQKLTGDLVLDVEIRPDGGVHAINVVRPSGHQVLDDAAVRIVRLAAPYDPFPEKIRKEVDILHITRTWQFIRGDRLVSR